MDSESIVSEFLEHYGVKGMKKPVSPQRLDRVARVANGTAILKDRIQKARKTSAKAIVNAQKQAKEVAAAQAAALLETTGKPMIKIKEVNTTDNKEDAVDGESEAQKLLKQCGATKISDLG